MDSTDKVEVKLVSQKNEVFYPILGILIASCILLISTLFLELNVNYSLASFILVFSCMLFMRIIKTYKIAGSIIFSKPEISINGINIKYEEINRARINIFHFKNETSYSIQHNMVGGFDGLGNYLEIHYKNKGTKRYYFLLENKKQMKKIEEIKWYLENITFEKNKNPLKSYF